jgi:hypothetical protein
MTDHSEFPWGPQYEPGLLTPFGLLGWIVAAVLLLLLLWRMANPAGPKAGEDRLNEIHTAIMKAARDAQKQQYFGSPGAAHALRQAIKYQLGGVQAAGEALTKQLKALDKALGEGDDKDKKKDDHQGKDAHGGHHGSASATAVAQNVAGPSITVNVGVGEKAEATAGDGAHHDAHGAGHGSSHGGGHGAHGAHGEDEDKPLTLGEQLIAVEKAIRDFEAWWQNKPVRMGELRAAQNDLIRPRKPDPEATPTKDKHS